MNLGKWTATGALVAALTLAAAGLYAARPAAANQEPVHVTQPGYRMALVADQFSAPVGVAVGRKNELYVAESGVGTNSPPRVIRWSPGHRRSTVASDFPAPLTGITLHEGKLYVSYVGGVDILDPASGVHHPILRNLPAFGDYPNGAVLFGPDGKLYVGIGAATNAAVVGEDNVLRGWVKQNPGVHDIPCRDITLRGSNFSVANALTPEPRDLATTGGFSAFGTTTSRLQVVRGAVPCTAAVLRANPDGTGLEMFAWGLRYPAGLAFGPDLQFYATVQGYEDRGSRPVVGDHDYLYRLEESRWYGWPDFAGAKPLTAEEFQKPSMPVHPLLSSPPGQPPMPVTAFAPGAGAAGLLFPAESLGFHGEALVALSRSGGQIVRVNPRTGVISEFAQIKGEAAWPLSLAAGPDGSIYVVNYGKTRPAAGGWEPVPGTGSVLRITRATARQSLGPDSVPWQWALVAMVLSLAGLRLVRPPR